MNNKPCGKPIAKQVIGPLSGICYKCNEPLNKHTPDHTFIACSEESEVCVHCDLSQVNHVQSQ